MARLHGLRQMDLMRHHIQALLRRDLSLIFNPL